MNESNNDILMLLLKENDSKIINAAPIKDVVHNKFINEYKSIQSSTRLSDDLMFAFDNILNTMRIHEFEGPSNEKVIEKLTFGDVFKTEIKKYKP
jgi:hypothetical protein